MQREIQTKEVALEIVKYDDAPVEMRHRVPRSLKFRPTARQELLRAELWEVLTELDIFLEDAATDVPAAIRGLANSNLEYHITVYVRPSLPHELDEYPDDQDNKYSITVAFGRSVRNTYLSRENAYMVAIYDIDQEFEKLSQRLKKRR